LRKILIILLLLALIWNTEAQVARVQNNPDYDFKLIHFGFTVGLNTMDFGIRRPVTTDYFADVSNISPGFQVSIVSELRLGEYFSLRFLPGITFGQRNLNFFIDSIRDTGMQLESNFLDFPLLIKYKSKRVNNYRPYFIGGTNIRYDLAARKDYEEGSNIYVRLKPLDVYLEIGFGVDIYLQYFKFSPELKLSMGLRNVLVDDPAEGFPQYVNAIDRLNSYIVMLCFHFE
jgi:hypothetical protein